MAIRDFDPTKGCAFQGDVAFVPLPATITIATHDEIKPIPGPRIKSGAGPATDRLIIQEGEASGHHHAIELRRARRFRDDTRPLGDPSVMTSPGLRRAFGGTKPAPTRGTARLYRDPQAVAQMQALGILTRTDLAIGCLVVEGGPVVVSHQEHDSIRLPPGNYLIGRQVESAGAEERAVAD